MSTKQVRSAATKQAGRLHPASSASVPARLIWRRWLEELAAFKKEHGHCCVSTLDERHFQLGNWVRTQRGRRKRGKLSEEQIGVLDEVGFFWDGHERYRVKWESMCEALAAYQRAHGDCQMPFSIADDSKLANWLVTQRCARRKGKLSAERVRRLDELGFVWDLLDERWERMFAALVKYKEAHGDCNVPAAWPPNPHLATWVRKQRTCHAKGTLPSNQRERLEALGFRFGGQGIVRKRKEKPKRSSRPKSRPIGSSTPPAPAKPGSSTPPAPAKPGSSTPPAPARPSSLSLIWRQIRQERSKRK